MKHLFFLILVFIFILSCVSHAAAEVNVTLADNNSEKCNLGHAAAANRVKSVGIGISTSCGCSDRGRSCCTSLEQIRCRSIDGIVGVKQASGCPITITGGTETGHASGPNSHWNGYKLDWSLNACIEGYIKKSSRYQGRRGDGAECWVSSNNNHYCKEGNHWDTTFL